jgi:SAM-dependent methyltransferase
VIYKNIKNHLKTQLNEDTFLYNILSKVNLLVHHLFKKKIAENKIRNYINSLERGQEFKVIFGGHWFDTDDWLVLTEDEQDITKPLKFANNSVDVIFTEHVIEHIEFIPAIRFLQESCRILKKDGIFRVVCPMIEKLISADFNDEYGSAYITNSLLGAWADENEILNKLNLNGVFESPGTFFLNRVFTKHGHRFIWSVELMIKVLEAIGFSQVRRREVGEGINQDYCIERRSRGLYLGRSWQADRLPNMIYDPESLVVEAKK